jgi:cob(I)alamin adenosyltransferase
MGNRLTKIYTRTGDDGTTGLGDGVRVGKDTPRIEAMGDVDELNSLIGLLISTGLPDDIRRLLTDIQHALFDLGGELSMPGHTFVRESYVQVLEQAIDQYNAGLPALKEFILPGGNEAACRCHLARAVCRRAERRVVELGRVEPVNLQTAIYLNRLSDLLFVLARTLARLDGGQEVYWEKGRLS